MALLYVGVESVEMNFDIRGADILDQSRGVLQRVEEIGFEAVQRFQANGDVAFSRALCRLLKTFHSPLPLFLRAPAARHHAQPGIQRTANQACPQLGSPLD